MKTFHVEYNLVSQEGQVLATGSAPCSAPALTQDAITEIKNGIHQESLEDYQRQCGEIERLGKTHLQIVCIIELEQAALAGWECIEAGSEIH